MASPRPSIYPPSVSLFLAAQSFIRTLQLGVRASSARERQRTDVWQRYLQSSAVARSIVAVKTSYEFFLASLKIRVVRATQRLGSHTPTET